MKRTLSSKGMQFLTFGWMTLLLTLEVEICNWGQAELLSLRRFVSTTRSIWSC